MPSFELQIAAAGDDARTFGSWPGDGGYSDSGLSARIGYDGGNHFMVGLRFADVPIAGGGTIVVASAQLQVRAAAYAYSAVNWRIWAEDVDDAAAMGAGHTPYDAYLARTTAYNSKIDGYWGWFEGDWYSLNCKASLQEVLDRAGWALNNAVLFAITPENSTEPGHQMSMYDDDSSYAAKLLVSYDSVPHSVSVINDDPGGV